jgi:flagellin
MALQINTNLGAIMASAAASSVNKSMETSMTRLATGSRINTAADDAAGVAIASRLTSEIRGTNQAVRNAMDAQAMIDTAEGAHNEIVNILQRMRELAVQAANDTNDADDRDNLQAETDQLVDEIDRIATVTTWAGVSLLDAWCECADHGVQLQRPDHD